MNNFTKRENNISNSEYPQKKDYDKYIYNGNGKYPLLEAIYQNNYKIANLIIEYANDHHIPIDINDKNYCGDYPLLVAIKNGNTKLIRLLMKYADSHKIILNIDEKYMASLPYVNKDIINLLKEYKNTHTNLPYSNIPVIEKVSRKRKRNF
ncbi:hypothetical protein PIROE2DRAFT_11519 [Piromyces sp. E2]|nr:hypothetical protein PIROE2DRAFT_11519 [Piromyces sp. E2]|eukprot:OUM62260.1 hypothetical protein PIROE2DRAFT_11519 [Piromyces sp. E2]